MSRHVDTMAVDAAYRALVDASRLMSVQLRLVLSGEVEPEVGLEGLGIARGYLDNARVYLDEARRGGCDTASLEEVEDKLLASSARLRLWSTSSE